MFIEKGDLTMDIDEKLDYLLTVLPTFVCQKVARLGKPFLYYSIDMPIISEEHMDALEAPITLDEIDKAILALRSNYFPGPDGLTPKFYKKKLVKSISIHLHKQFFGIFC